ncbi:MAG: carboxylating nicotinate-nucleotide diphosphorylase [Saprospiraceae bacterium]|nr:carboxylating nicotinate-nucleotide diphosphorylase [Saprospiraceae bacterium]
MSYFNIQQFIKEALNEDIQTGDITSLACIPADDISHAILKVKEDGVLAGVELAKSIFQYIDPEIHLNIFKLDGSYIHYGDIAFEVKGKTRDLLKAERLILNSMQRMSGIATLSNRYVVEVSDLPVQLLDTRKTTPLIRYLEKWAVKIGGCKNYRDGLYDWFMIKDNHITACGSIIKAIKAVKKYQKTNNLENLGITVEVKNLEELEQVLRFGNVTRVMLDNFALPLLAEGGAMGGKKLETEASGGISLETVRKVALTGVAFISIGALTPSAGSLDLSLKIQN